MWITFAACSEGNHKKEKHPDDREINVEIRDGFNSSMSLVSNLKIKDVIIDEVQNNYKVGYFGALFMCFNMKGHFIQPEMSHNISRCEITFGKLGSQHPDIEPDYVSANSTTHDVGFSLLYGYHVVRQGPYSMPLFTGPKLRYLWNQKSKITFENFDQQGIHGGLRPFNASAVVGISVSISHIFFDFYYERGLRNLSKSVIYDNIDIEDKPEVSNITSQRRGNVLSFSLGVIL